MCVKKVIEYYDIKSKELLKFGFKLVNIDISSFNDAVIATFVKENKKYHSIYILEDYIGQGVYQRVYRTITQRLNINPIIITAKQCNIEPYLKYKMIPYVSVDTTFGYVEYEIIKKYYKENKSKRSDVRLMNHIDEGLTLLNGIEATEDAKRAYCLHPIIQTETSLENFDFSGVSEHVMELAIEYKRVANSYLSNRKITHINEIELSDKFEVNDMLLADKIQNYKDFLLYHKDTHSRSDELENYFRNWFKKLTVRNGYWLELRDLINVRLTIGKYNENI